MAPSVATSNGVDVKNNDEDRSEKQRRKADNFGLLVLGARSWFF